MTAAKHDLYERFKRLVYERSDLHFSPRKRAFFERQLADRAAACGFGDLEAYFWHVHDNPDGLDGLLQCLTTHQTSFFRNPAQFSALREVILPELVAARNREVISSWGGPGSQVQRPGRHPAMNIRIWSSGCSTGEEAYSIAFSLLDAIRYIRAWDVEVLGTDINRAVLAAARAGVYDGSQLPELARWGADRHVEAGGGTFRVGEDTRRLVRFRESNLKGLTSSRPRRLELRDEAGREEVMEAAGLFDMIFCRNVMIYFDRDGQQRLVDALFDCLKPGGYLFTGDSEPLHLFSHGFERAGGGDALYYRKP
ncbi:MAG: protein-glutamate O-methyltransferase CheR [Nitrospirae bacterium]|nr:protein-glutamate O-methyltransferase CheR [Nitrospirota bacterium]